MSTPPSTTLASGERPLPILGRSDLRCEPVDYDGSASWIVKDPIALQYFRVLPEQHRLLQLLDGRRSLRQLGAALKQEFPESHFRLFELQQLISDLHQKGLVWSARGDQGTVHVNEQRDRWRKQSFHRLRNVLFIRLPGWDPERSLRFLYPLVRWMFTPFAFLSAMVLVVSAWGFLLTHADEFHRQLPAFAEFFTWPNVVFLWITIGAAKIVHELAHGLACHHFGGECHEIGVALLVFSPCLYCDVSDAWLLRRRRDRMLISAAGMFIEVLISACALFLWWNSAPGLFRYLCINTFLVTTLTTVIFNANPLLRYDGYYILSDWLEVPNLQSKARIILRQALARTCFGIRLPDDPFAPPHRRGWFLSYALLSMVYRWALIWGIGLFLYRLLKPYGAEVLSYVYGIAALTGIVVGIVSATIGMLRIPGRDTMSKLRVCMSASVLVGLAALIGSTPIPLHGKAPLTIEPFESQHVYAGVSGILTDVLVRPGDRVSANQVIAELSDPKLNDQLLSLQHEQQRSEVDAELSQALGDSDQKLIVAEQLRTIAEQIGESRRRQQRLTVRAPCEGVVVPPPTTPETIATGSDELPAWSGEPLEERNLGCLLSAGTQLCAIAPSRNWQAVMLVDQSHRRDLAVGDDVTVKLDSFPATELTGSVVRISRRGDDQVPMALSNKSDGSVPTHTDRRGRERGDTATYQVTVLLDPVNVPLRAGMRGRSRFVVREQTISSKLRQLVQRHLLFRK